VIVDPIAMAPLPGALAPALLAGGAGWILAEPDEAIREISLPACDPLFRRPTPEPLSRLSRAS